MQHALEIDRAFATLDQLSGGRFLLGLGLSGPQVVEGWHGQPYGKPLSKTREYVSIVRDILKREQPPPGGSSCLSAWQYARATPLRWARHVAAKPQPATGNRATERLRLRAVRRLF